MRIILGLLASVFSASAALSQETVDIQTFLDDPSAWHEQEILIEGFITFEDYGKALFRSEDAFLDADYAQSIPLILPNNLIDMREAFERTWVRIRGGYDHGCAGPTTFCSAHPGQGRLIAYELWGIAIPEAWVGWRAPVVAVAMDEMSPIEPEAIEPLMLVAGQTINLIRTGDAKALANMVSSDARALFEEELADQYGRANWLLFTGHYPLQRTFAEGAPVGSDAGYRAETYPLEAYRLNGADGATDAAAVCICYAEECSFGEPVRPDIVTQRSFTDPFVCLPFHETDVGWRLDAGFFVSTGRLADFGGDLGTVFTLQEGSNQTVGVNFTTPMLEPSRFVSLLRSRPRARVVDSVGSGRVNVPAYQMVTPDLIWVAERSAGEAVVRRLDVGTD